MSNLALPIRPADTNPLHRGTTISPNDPISTYLKSAKSATAAIGASLRKSIDSALPTATAKIWHAIPVWFVGDNPVVGFHVRPADVTLLFWNGQAFDEPALGKVGKFKAAQIRYTDLSEIDPKALKRWLAKAKSDVWDLAGLRKKTLAKKRAA